jgi:hypothetical protein
MGQQGVLFLPMPPVLRYAVSSRRIRRAGLAAMHNSSMFFN